MIKKRNLDNSLIQWIMTQTSLGPGIGDIKYVVPASSATSQFRTQLQENGVEDGDMYTTLATAEAAVSAYRNDLILVMPGLYTESAELDWDKAWTHILGLGGPHHLGDWAEPNVVVRTTDTAVVYTIDISGANCQFHNIQFNNYGANAVCKAAANVNKYGLFFKNVAFRGNMTSQQAGNATCASLYIDQSGFNPIFEGCIIGENEWGTRTQSNSGQLFFYSAGAAGAPSNGLFKNCRFLSRSDTAAVAMVRIPQVDNIGRGWLFDNCFFYNLSGNQTNLNQVFSSVTSGSDNIPSVNLHHCFATGFDEWQDEDAAMLLADMPIVGIGGGLGREPTGTTGN